MSAPPAAVLSIPSVAHVAKSQIWTEVKPKADAAMQEEDTNIPSFIPTDACAELIRRIRKDYEKNADKFLGRPRKISRCRGGGLIFLPGNTSIGTAFMIIEPIFCEGKSKIGEWEVDMDHYYVILKECDIHVEDNGKLVALAMSNIE